jgi:hypothetical protein
VVILIAYQLPIARIRRPLRTVTVACRPWSIAGASVHVRQWASDA